MSQRFALELARWISLLSMISRGKCNMEGYIVAGELANIIDFPHSVFLSIEFRNNMAINCGASLISSQTVLTAAHCLDALQQSPDNLSDSIRIYAMFGHENYEKAILKRRIIDFKAHEGYDGELVINDLAVLFLHKPVKFTDTIKKILVSRDTPKSGQKAFVAGWGATQNPATQGSPTTKLRFTQLPVLGTKACEKYINSPPKGAFCAGHNKGKGYAFSGDSGSALIMHEDTQIGIVSYKEVKSNINVFTDVAYFYKWIEKTNDKLFKKNCKT